MGLHRWFHNQFPPFLPLLHCPLGLAELQACPFPDVVFPLLPLSALSSSPFTVPCKMVFARPDERETWPYHCSLHLFTMFRRFSCGPTAFWILAQASSLVTWSLYEMCSTLWYSYSSCKSSIAQPHRCTRTSPGNCPETETCMVQACHTTASPKPSFRAPRQVGNAVVGRGNAGWTTSKSGHPCLCQNCWH